MTITLETVDDIMHKPSPSWLVRDWIPLPVENDESICLLYGPSGKGKSFVALDLALSIAAGIPWVEEYPTERGAILYIAAEGTGGLKRRIAAWREQHPKANVEDALFLLQAIDIYDEGERDELFDMLERMLDEGDFLHEEDGWVHLEKPLRLVVIDTVARMYRGDDENDNRQMGQFIEAVQVFSRKYGAAVLLVHHSSKGDITNERGGGALRGAATACYLCTGKHRDGKLREVNLKCNKMKDADEGSVDLRMEEHELLELDRDDAGRIRTGGALTFVSAQSEEEAMDAQDDEVPPSDEENLLTLLREAGELTAGEWWAQSKLSRATFKRRVLDLKTNKKIVKKGANYKLRKLGSHDEP